MSCPETPVLEVKGVRKYYGDKPAVNAEHLAFPVSTITAFWGANGAGKSTLLRILACLDHPQQGEVLLHGNKLEERGDWFKARKVITMVDQNPYAFRSSVFSNVAFGLKARGMKTGDSAAKVEQALADVGLAGTGRRRAQTLSGGELQRMAIARAMVCGPEVLVLDEPTAHVDSGSVRGIEQTVTALRDNKGTSIVLATHDSSQAFRLADRVLHIEDGTVCETGPTIRDGSLERREGRLVVRSPGAESCGQGLQLAGIELSGDYCILTIHPEQLRVRVLREQVETARPVPGEDLDISF